jgi:hypothetical protein
MATTRVKISGPLFDGQAEEAAARFCAEITKEIAEYGQFMIKMDTQRMDKSARGGTGRAAEGVQLTGAGTSYTIRGGIREGESDWPWLEGTSKRNASTGFKGYGSFRRARLRLRKTGAAIADLRLKEFIAAMGGGEE